MNELQALQSKSDFAHFLDRLQRWHKIVFDETTIKEMRSSFSRTFIKEDFNYCEKVLIENDNKKFSLSPADIYKICLKSKKEREKSERLKKEIDGENNLAVNKAGRNEVEKAVKKLQSALKNKKQEKTKGSDKLKICLYEYVDLSNGKTEKVIAQGDYEECLFKRACKEKFYSSPHTIKKIYHKYVKKEQLDKSGNTYGSYMTLIPVSSMCEGSSIYTVGYY